MRNMQCSCMSAFFFFPEKWAHIFYQILKMAIPPSVAGIILIYAASLLRIIIHYSLKVFKFK